MTKIDKKDCASIGYPTRRAAIIEANALTISKSEQHDVVKIGDLWYAYNRVKLALKK